MRPDARIKGSSISLLRGNTGSKGQRLKERTQPYSPWREAKTEGSTKLWSPSDTRLDPPAAALDAVSTRSIDKSKLFRIGQYSLLTFQKAGIKFGLDRVFRGLSFGGSYVIPCVRGGLHAGKILKGKNTYRNDDGSDSCGWTRSRQRMQVPERRPRHLSPLPSTRPWSWLGMTLRWPRQTASRS